MHYPKMTAAPPDELRVTVTAQSAAIEVASAEFAAWNLATCARDDGISHQLAALRSRLAALRS